ncbi:MAG: outer membrane protein assembly factor BamD [Alphaproteobacteria bacterium]
MLKNITKLLSILFVSFVLTACGSDEPEKQVERPAKELYEMATTAERNGDTYKDVIKAYEEVERQHPQSDYAKKAIANAVMYAYANMNYEDAVMFAENFIAYNPNHKLAPKITYIRALSYYEQISDIGRDQGNTDKAFEALNDIIISYPNTDYAINAKYKLDLAIDHLAGKELDVGRFYQDQGDYQAALTRFNNIVKNYSHTSQTPEALARMVETYLALGLYQEAYRTGAILGHNHQGNYWYRHSYELLQKHKP